MPRTDYKDFRSFGYLDEAHRHLLLMLFDRRSSHPVAEAIELRQAIRDVLDRHQLVMQDFWRPTVSPLTDGMLGYEPSPVGNGDIERAKELLSEAGYPEGAGLKGLSLCSRDGMKEHAQSIELQIEEIGLTVNTEICSYDSWHRYLTEGGCDMVIAAYDELVIEDDPTVLVLGLASRARLVDRHPHTRELIGRLRAAAGNDDRISMIQQLAAEIVDDSILIFLLYREPTEPHFRTLIGPRVMGLADPDTGMMNPRRQRVREMWVEDD